MTAGVVLCAFGEPAEPDHDVVVDYLQRIFRRNARLESPATDDEAADRARELAERRAPGLLEEYAAIGGSPLNGQAAAQAEAVERVLTARDRDAATFLGLQFTAPFIEDAVAAARSAGVDRLVGLPLYPLCGPSTTVAALERLRDAVDATNWAVPLDEISGWHRHPAYARLRADGVGSFVAERGVDLADRGTALVCAAHGTPLRYLDEGSRYRQYVEEHCETLASLLGVDGYVVGYQNHANRGVPWTQPAVEDAIVGLDADRVVVEPVSFLHEQSETLADLDIELRAEAASLGLDVHRVPVPHDDPRLAELLADLVEGVLAGRHGESRLRSCQCRATPATVCLDAPVTADATATDGR